MDPLGYQLVMRLRSDRNIAATVEARRLIARTILRVAQKFPLVAFRWGDTHGHAAVICDATRAAELARRIESALKQVLDLPVSFAPVELTPIRDVWHLKNVVRYILCQDSHHGIAQDRFHEASNLLDLLGIRTIGAWTAPLLRAQLARLRRTDILEMVGMEDPDRDPPLDGNLLDAAAAALALPVLGKDRESLRARVALVHLVAGKLTPPEIMRRLQIAPSTLRRLRATAPSKALKRAIRQQLVLRSPRGEKSLVG
jgi:pyrimidine operon attenuation protein/uracil phosphoribosyltransferase